MKKIFLFTIVCFLLAYRLSAQSGGPPVFQIDKLSPQDTLLNGWVFHAGDEISWAEPGVDDRAWKQTDPGTDVFSYQPFKSSKIIWLRLHVRADGAVCNVTLASWVYQFTASQIFLDGKLIKQYG